MPPVDWSVEPVTLVNEFAGRHGNANLGALILHGVWAVDGLRYLSELDAEDDLSTDTVRGYPPDRVDVAHVRWATATCITALDLCAAGLGRILCGHVGPKELAVSDFARTRKRSPKIDYRGRLPPAAGEWVDNLVADPGYKTVKEVRNALTHGLVRRHFTLPRLRLDIQVGETRISSPRVIEVACDTARVQIGKLLEILPKV